MFNRFSLLVPSLENSIEDGKENPDPDAKPAEKKKAKTRAWSVWNVLTSEQPKTKKGAADPDISRWFLFGVLNCAAVFC